MSETTSPHLPQALIDRHTFSKRVAFAAGPKTEASQYEMRMFNVIDRAEGRRGRS